MMKNLSDISFWKQNYGLLPLYLKDAAEKRFLMLNGGYGDFCLQTIVEGDVDLFKEYSWSSNTKNYLIVEKENIKIVNWLDSEPESIPKKAIEGNLGKFYKYLLSKSYKTQNDVVPFVIDIFKQLRNETAERQNPKNAISILFQLLISLEYDDLGIMSDKFIDFEKAHLPNNFEHYRDRLHTGVKSIKPNLDLILRHTSGALFQEAHKEVLYFDLQRDLFGGVSSQLITKIDSYSSIHYTPPYLARTIVENSLKDINLLRPNLRILDPSCGSSEFLIEALKQLKFLEYKGGITLVGYDSSPMAIETSKFLLHYENKTQWNEKIDLQVEVVDDSLTIDWGTNNDLILMNPPFVSWEQLKSQDSRDILKEVLGNSFTKGKPNQASAFFRKATQSLNESGVLGCVLPSSLLTFDSYKNLRNEITESLDLKLLAKLGNYVFKDALTDVSLFIGKKPQSKTYPRVIWTKNEKGIVPEALRELRKLQINNENAKLESSYNIYTPKIFPFLKDSWKLISYYEEVFIRDLEIFVADEKLTRLSNIFIVKQGIRTGSRIFILNSKDFEGIPVIEKKYYKKVIGNESIKNGYLRTNNYVWYPYSETGPIFSDNEDFESKAPFSYNRLLEHKHSLITRARKNNSNWWQLSEHRAWLREKKQRLFSTEFGKSDSFAFDVSEEIVVERGNGWIPKKKFGIDDYYFYLALFSSSTFDRLLSIYSKPILSGFYLGQDYTKDIPVPDITGVKKDETNYLKLVYLGKELEKGNSSAIYSINEEVQNLYPQI